MPGSIQQSDIYRLHESIDKNNFKNAFCLGISHMLAFLGACDFRFSCHFLLRLASSIITRVVLYFLVCRGSRRSDCSCWRAVHLSLRDELTRLQPLSISLASVRPVVSAATKAARTLANAFICSLVIETPLPQVWHFRSRGAIGRVPEGRVSKRCEEGGSNAD